MNMLLLCMLRLNVTLFPLFTLAEMKDDVNRCVEVLIAKLEIFEFEDDNRGLFTGINKNLSRENAVFPEKFAGEPGDNVYKFKEKFLETFNWKSQNLNW